MSTRKETWKEFDNMIKRDVGLTEYDAYIIGEALMQYRKRCLQNADNCMSGYGSAASSYKSQEWALKAHDAEQIAQKVIYEQGGM